MRDRLSMERRLRQGHHAADIVPAHGIAFMPKGKP